MIKLMNILKEDIYGNNAIVFHRTKISDLINKVYDEGFKPKDGDMYGKGFYSTYDLKSQEGPNMTETYGNIIVKFNVTIENFVVFDYSEFIKAPISRKIKNYTKEDFILKQLDFFGMKYDKEYLDKKLLSSKYSSEIALNCYNYIKNFTKLCEGIIFTGSRDGKVLVCYNPNKLVIPLSYKIDGEKDFTKTDKNLSYLKSIWQNKKNKFVPDLSAQPEEYGITNYKWNSKGELDVNQYVDLSSMNLTKIPFTFGTIKGKFLCYNNKLTTLKGAPQEVGGGFNCYNNKLTSLEGAPQKVGGSFYCENNKLTTLKGAPQEVGENFYCGNNNLTSLKGAPQEVGGGFNCYNNKLTSLEGAPQKVGENFYCENNKLTTLKGAPQEVGENFYCGNNNLTSLKGAPQEVGGDFWCNNNKLTSLDGAPQKVGGDFRCNNNLIKFTEEDVRKVCNVKRYISV